MSTIIRVLGGTLFLICCVGAPLLLARYQLTQQKNLRVVREGVLYRSGQMTLDGLEQAIDEYGIRTVITFRYPDDGEALPPDHEEEQFCKAHGVKYVRIKPKKWEAADWRDPAPAEESVGRFVEVMRDPKNHPVLVHCFAGVHRTGAFCAVYRIEFEGWPNERALDEMKACGYDNLDTEWDIRGYLMRYRPKGKR